MLALKCRGCGEVLFNGPGLERFELRAAVELVKAGEASGEVMRFMRKAAGLRGADLAELLDVTPETVSRCETGKQTIEHRAMTVLGSLLADKYKGRSVVFDNLKALRQPKKLGRKVVLPLGRGS